MVNTKIQQLKDDVRYLGNVLGEIIREQEGEWLFELEEKVRLSSIRMNEEKEENTDFYQELQQIFSGKTNKDLELLVRCFTTYFRLVNLAENVHRARRVNEYEKNPEKYNNKNSLNNLRDKLKLQKDEIESFLEMIQNLDIVPTLTAHPTEAKRRTIQEKLRRLYVYLLELNQEDISPAEKSILKSKIKAEITSMWHTHEVRLQKLQVMDEVSTGLFYLDSVFFDAIEMLYQKFYYSFGDIITEDFVLTPLIRLGSWIGGDRDGHPFVSPEITRETIILHKKHIISLYRKDIKKLTSILSDSELRIKFSQKFKDKIAEDMQVFEKEISQKAGNQFIKSPYELFRTKLSIVMEKLSQTEKYAGKKAKHKFLYSQVSEFYQDLNEIREILNSNNSEILSKTYIDPLLYKIRTFGFYFAKLDIRQHSGIIKKAVEEMLVSVDLINKDWSEYSHEEKKEILSREISSKRPLYSEEYDFSEQSQDLFKTMETLNWGMKNIDSEIFENFVISMCHDETDVLSLLLLFKEFGLYSLTGQQRQLKLNIVPLFESISDLRNSGKVLESLFSNRTYKIALESRNNFQEVMLGYSDSSKDGGILSSNWELYKAQKTIKTVCEQYSVNFRMFHGRGGSIGRGGGPSNEAILAQPPGTVNGKIRITEQGEMISTKYQFREIAVRTFEQVINAVVLATYNSRAHTFEKNPREELWTQTMEELSEYGFQAFRSFITKKDFISNFQIFTPLDLISRLDIGSRPTKRKNTESLDDLRAIPWVFSWMQTRLLLPGWYSVGTAFNNYLNKYGEEGLKTLQDMYKNWTYFSAFIKNVENALGKTNTEIAKIYCHLYEQSDKENNFVSNIMNEFQLTEELILKITGEEEILDHQEILKKSISLRNPYIDPMNFIQMNLLKEYRKLADDSAEKEEILLILRETVNGIAAGMKNTG